MSAYIKINCPVCFDVELTTVEDRLNSLSKDLATQEYLEKPDAYWLISTVQKLLEENATAWLKAREPLPNCWCGAAHPTDTIHLLRTPPLWNAAVRGYVTVAKRMLRRRA